MKGFIFRFKSIFIAAIKRWKIQKVMRAILSTKFGKETVDLIRLREDCRKSGDAFAENIFKTCEGRLERF